MIKYEKFVLENGLRVIVHEDKSTPMAVLDVMYDVGARDEEPHRTGFAHLFEHLMFGGSINIESYDEPLQMAGGENNAYTTNDLTNYYLQIPAENIETGFWLESDRMLSLGFNENSLDVQRKVVIEEFKEHYINRPYGNVWHKLRELAYKEHPYKWMTIGKELSHVENAQLQDVKDFFFKHYTPCNAILVVAGNITVSQVKELAEKWFGDIPSGDKYVRNIPQEPVQKEPQFLEIEAEVPLDALYKCWHISTRLDKRYYVADMITEILGGGTSSRLFQSLVKEQQLFSSIQCSHLGSIDAGLLYIDGKLIKGISIEEGEKAISGELDKMKTEKISETELQKIKNKTESLLAFEDISLMNRANSLANYELLGDADLMNKELLLYHAVTADDILEECRRVFVDTNCSTLYYRSTTSMPDSE
ncbi:MAG: pitrilysin family protein [Bacteroidota bacterium]|jgi:zinc protease|nr:pitrilysin family protein [Bacteroidota bacterium]